MQSQDDSYGNASDSFCLYWEIKKTWDMGTINKTFVSYGIAVSLIL
jgi:hypothetical protein